MYGAPIFGIVLVERFTGEKQNTLEIELQRKRIQQKQLSKDIVDQKTINPECRPKES